jgi:hypothetical protein
VTLNRRCDQQQKDPDTYGMTQRSGICERLAMQYRGQRQSKILSQQWSQLPLRFAGQSFLSVMIADCSAEWHGQFGAAGIRGITSEMIFFAVGALC